jgi:hypothetical protein
MTKHIDTPDTLDTDERVVHPDDLGSWYETVIIGTRGAHIDLFRTKLGAYQYGSAVAQGYGWTGAEPLDEFLSDSEDIAYADVAQVRRLY